MQRHVACSVVLSLRLPCVCSFGPISPHSRRELYHYIIRDPTAHAAPTVAHWRRTTRWTSSTCGRATSAYSRADPTTRAWLAYCPAQSEYLSPCGCGAAACRYLTNFGVLGYGMELVKVARAAVLDGAIPRVVWVPTQVGWLQVPAPQAAL